MRGCSFLAGAAVLAFAVPVGARAASAVTVMPTSQEPTKAVTVAGTGFGASEAVDVYLDTTDTLLLVSGSGGSFSGSLTVPAATLPGTHYATAIGRHSGAAAQLAFTVSTPWYQFGFGAGHHGVNPYETVLSTSSVASLGTVWNNTTNTTGSTPAVVVGRVYVGTTTGMSAVNTVTGAAVWTKNLSASFYASPTVVDGHIYIGDNSGDFYALNTTNGATLWKANFTDYYLASAVVANGIVYIGGLSGTFYALNATTGATIWSYATGGGIDSSAALGNGNVCFGSEDNKVYCLSATTGALAWSYTTGAEVESSPAIANGVLYVGSDDENVYAIGTSPATNGALLWSYKTSGGVYASPVIYDNEVYVGSGDGNFYALDGRTGALRFALSVGGVVRSAAAANGVLYFTSSTNFLYAVATYGSVLASASLGMTYFGSPAVSDGRVFLSTYEGTLAALAPGAGMDVVPARAPRVASLRRDMGLRATLQ